MSYSLIEGFVSGQVPDQATKYGSIESVVADRHVSLLLHASARTIELGTQEHLRFTFACALALPLFSLVSGGEGTRTKGSRGSLLRGICRLPCFPFPSAFALSVALPITSLW